MMCIDPVDNNLDENISNSILASVKKLLGITYDYTNFDADIKMHINTVLTELYQIGVMQTPIIISDYTTEWSDLLGDRSDLELVKTFVAMKVRMLFDPPTSSVVMGALEKSIAELEWRISVTVDPGNEE